MPKGVAARMATIRVQHETAEPRGWLFVVRVTHDDGRECEHAVRLAWVDHDHWSGGRVAPSRTIEAVLKFVADHAPGQPWPERFDAARARRWVPSIDRELPLAI